MIVVWIVLDALPARWARPATTPVLARLAGPGGPGRATGVLTAATYPNHATFATGRPPTAHGVLTNRVWDGVALRPADEVGAAVPTIAELLTVAGRSTAAVVGDHHLVGVMGLRHATVHWPPRGELPAGTELDLAGYATDAAVVEQVERLLAGSTPELDLLLVHLNGPDTAAHLHGPDSAAARDQYRSTDAHLGRIVDLVVPFWDDAVVLITSDHDQETVLVPEPIDLGAELVRRGLPWIAAHEGSAAVLHRAGPSDGSTPPPLTGEEWRTAIDADTILLWCGPGRWFGSSAGLRGVHGSPRTVQQLAVVTGGHPAAAAVAHAVRAGRVTALDWLPTVLGLLDVRRPPRPGRNLAPVLDREAPRTAS